MRKAIFAVVCLSVAMVANAQIGPAGHTFGTATFIPHTTDPFSAIGVEALTSGYADFYSISLSTNEVLTAAVTPLDQQMTSPAIELGIFDSTQTLVAFDNGGSGNGFQGIASYLASAPGTYYIGVTGSGDDTFTGNHTQSGNYQFVVGTNNEPVPEPASLAVLGFGIATLARRRASKKGAIR